MASDVEARRRRKLPLEAQLPCGRCDLSVWGDEEFRETCRCGITYHKECYWGRVVPLEEWRAWCRVMLAYDYDPSDDEDIAEPDIVCVACRQFAGLGKGEA